MKFSEKKDGKLMFFKVTLKMEIIQYSSRFSPTERKGKEIEFILAPLLPERVLIHISDFTMHKRSAVFGEKYVYVHVFIRFL